MMAGAAIHCIVIDQSNRKFGRIDVLAHLCSISPLNQCLKKFEATGGMDISAYCVKDAVFLVGTGQWLASMWQLTSQFGIVFCKQAMFYRVPVRGRRWAIW